MIWLAVLLIAVLVIGARLFVRWRARARKRWLAALYPGALDHEAAHAFKQEQRRWELNRLARIRRGCEGIEPWSFDRPQRRKR